MVRARIASGAPRSEDRTMRRTLQALLLSALAVTLALPAAPEASAADLGVRPRKAVRVIHHRVRVVRDYDGTPIVLRRARPLVVRDHDGTTRVVRPLAEAWPVYAAPGRYLNGEPVQPITRPRYVRFFRG
jgi:hypothetical protein